MTPRTPMLRTAILVTAALTLVVVIAAMTTATTMTTASGSEEDTIRKSFTVESGGKLILDTDIGSVEVRGTEAGSVDIAVHREVRHGDRDKILREFKLKFEQRGNDVTVTGDRERHGFHWLWDNIWSRLKVRFVITVPQAFDVDVRTSGGGVDIADLRGKVAARTSGGSVSCDRIGGDVEARTSGGSVRIGVAEGHVEAHTSGGDVRIERAGGEVDAHTSGGSITVDEVGGALRAKTSGGSVTATISAQPRSRCELTTSGGSVTIRLAADVAVDVDAHASGGHVEADVPMTVQGELGRSSLKAKINGGGPELYLRTSGGSIHIKKRD
jgi:Putative adhesin